MGSQRQERAPEGRIPDIGANAVVGEISRRELSGAADAKVAIFPSREGGIPFLEENNAWGFVRIGQNPEYAGMYITGDVGAVMYVARIKEIVPASDATLSRPLESYTGDQATFDQNKRVVVFEPESLYELSDPIPLATRFRTGCAIRTSSRSGQPRRQMIFCELAVLLLSELVCSGSYDDLTVLESFKR